MKKTGTLNYMKEFQVHIEQKEWKCETNFTNLRGTSN